MSTAQINRVTQYVSGRVEPEAVPPYKLQFTCIDGDRAGEQVGHSTSHTTPIIPNRGDLVTFVGHQFTVFQRNFVFDSPQMVVELYVKTGWVSLGEQAVEMVDRMRKCRSQKSAGG